MYKLFITFTKSQSFKMKKLINLLPLCIVVVFFTVSCNTKNGNNTQNTATATANVSSPAITDFCFLKAENKDTTQINLHIKDNTVTGIMNWIPYEKDGARGTLKGTKNANGELELLYDYIIEGSKQTETKIMKIEGDQLLVKIGELEDPKNDGNLRYKNANTATYTETLSKVACKK